MPEWAVDKWGPRERGRIPLGTIDATDRVEVGTYKVGPNKFEWQGVCLFAKVQNGTHPGNSGKKSFLFVRLQ